MPTLAYLSEVPSSNVFRGARKRERRRERENWNPRPAIQAVYSGRTCIGHLLLRGRAGIEAFDAADRSLGIYATPRAAADAISAEAGDVA